MRPRSSLTEQQRETLVDLFETGIGSGAASKQLGVSRDSVRMLERRWKLHGRLCLVDKPTKPTYSFEFKKQVVERFLAGASSMELASEFNLSSEQIVKTWVRHWRLNGDGALRPRPKGRPKGSEPSTPVTEADRLRRQVARLEAENAYLKKLRDLRDQGLV